MPQWMGTSSQRLRMKRKMMAMVRARPHLMRVLADRHGKLKSARQAGLIDHSRVTSRKPRKMPR